MPQITVDGRAFLAALRSVTPHASDDEELPQIRRVCLEIGSELTLSATNRVTAAAAFAPLLDVDGEMWQAAVLPGDAKEIARLFKLGKDENSILQISTEADRLFVTDMSGLFPGREFAVPNVDDGDSPSVPQLLADTLTRDYGPLGTPVFNSGLLALFDAAGREYRAPLVWTPTGDQSPVIVQCGEAFLGLLMPGRLAGDAREHADGVLTEWADRLPTPRRQEVAA